MSPGPNLMYYTGVKAQLLERPFLLFISSRDGRADLLAPKLEAEPFKGSGLEVALYEWDDTEGPGDALGRLLSKIDVRGRWGCEGRAPFGFVDHLLKRGMKIRQADQVLQTIRAIKDPDELRATRDSARTLVEAYLKIPDWLREGMTERDLSRMVTEDILAGGGESVEGCMVQSGARAALPHSETSSKKISRGDSVVVDTVSFLDGYAADITRTFAIGRDSKFEEVYSSVLEAQERAVEKAVTGVTVGAIDGAARGSLEAAGLGERFIHRTGHGLGLEVHEAPYIVSGGRERLKEGMVFTVEPGAYLPGRLGVRIEDDVIAVRGGREVATAKLPKDIGWWR